MVAWPWLVVAFLAGVVLAWLVPLSLLLWRTRRLWRWLVG